MFGKLYTFYSIKLTYLAALFLFELGSLICAVAHNSTTLIIGRAIAGVGGAGVASGAFLIIALLAPLRLRPFYTGIIGSMYGIACVCGPLLGGVFTDNPKLTWRWCFYINLPFGFITGVGILLCATLPPRDKAGKTSFMDQLKQMDIPGTVVLLCGVISLILALQWGGTKYEWNSGRIIALLVIAGILLVGFVLIQILSGEKATVRPRVIKNSNVWGTVIFGACGVGAFFIFLFYVCFCCNLFSSYH
jgi:MFS family permease